MGRSHLPASGRWWAVWASVIMGAKYSEEIPSLSVDGWMDRQIRWMDG